MAAMESGHGIVSGSAAFWASCAAAAPVIVASTHRAAAILTYRMRSPDMFCRPSVEAERIGDGGNYKVGVRVRSLRFLALDVVSAAMPQSFPSRRKTGLAADIAKAALMTHRRKSDACRKPFGLYSTRSTPASLITRAQNG